MTKECECAAHSAAECVCGAWDEPQRQWVGLTDKERLELWLKTESEEVDRYAFANAIEAKLKEKNT